MALQHRFGALDRSFRPGLAVRAVRFAADVKRVTGNGAHHGIGQFDPVEPLAPQIPAAAVRIDGPVLKTGAQRRGWLRRIRQPRFSMDFGRLGMGIW